MTDIEGLTRLERRKDVPFPSAHLYDLTRGMPERAIIIALDANHDQLQTMHATMQDGLQLLVDLLAQSLQPIKLISGPAYFPEAISERPNDAGDQPTDPQSIRMMNERDRAIALLKFWANLRDSDETPTMGAWRVFTEEVRTFLRAVDSHGY